MTDPSYSEIGTLKYDAGADEHRSHPLTVPMLERDDAEIVFTAYVADPSQAEFHTVVRNLLSSSRETLHAASQELQKYCDDINEFCEPEDELHVDNPHDLWRHVQLGKVIYVQRRRYGDRKLYATIECECDWEPEHGLQIVLREGLTVTKLGPYDGHLSNADSFADAALESVVYRQIH
jgi:hypothetical protein